MQRIINFILDYKNAFLYAVLLLLGLIITIRSHSYHQSKFFNSSKRITGFILSTSSAISGYFSLKEENQRLVLENEGLRLQLFNQDNFLSVDEKNGGATYQIINARIVKNSYASPRNYITINKGEEAGVTQDMGVITPWAFWES